MHFKFTEEELLIVSRLAGTVSTVEAVQGNRELRRKIQRVKNKFAPGAKAVFIKPSQIDFVYQILKGTEAMLENAVASAIEEKNSEKTTKMSNDLATIQDILVKIEKRVSHEAR